VNISRISCIIAPKLGIRPKKSKNCNEEFVTADEVKPLISNLLLNPPVAEWRLPLIDSSGA
jgi:hypothetical protein